MKTRQRISIGDFGFHFAGYGHFTVTYTSPRTGKIWKFNTNDMPLVDKFKGHDDFDLKRCDLEKLRRLVKNGGALW